MDDSYFEKPRHHLEIIIPSRLGSKETPVPGGGICSPAMSASQIQGEMSSYVDPTFVNQPPNLSRHLASG